MRKRWLAALVVTLAVTSPTIPAGASALAKESVENGRHDVFYEIYVNSFFDADGDGHGDLKGIIEKLDYLNDGNPHTQRDLGVTGLWLMPITVSPSYHKYDVTDYYNVDPIYGSLADFRKLVKEAHKRGIKVTIDLVINHTSSDHPWFKEASRDPHSKYRNYYIWADENTDLNETGPWGQKLWYKNPNGDGYFYSTFWEGMPDLNFDNPEVRKEIINIGKFWLQQGADGFRLDAAMHIYPGQKPDGAKKNYEWWSEFRREMEKVKPDVLLTGEVWDSVQVIAPYYGCLDSNFDFPLAERIMASVAGGSDQGIAELAESSNALFASYNREAVDSPFLTNHDQERVMSVVNGDENKAKVAASILLTMPGNPYLYYGEEIGMAGKKPDEYIREPFRWYTGSGKGQTTWETPIYNTGEDGVSVEAQDRDKHSLLSHYRGWIHYRQSDEAIRDGEIHPIAQTDKRLVAFTRTAGDKTAVVLHNLSADPIDVNLDQLGIKKAKIAYQANGRVQMKQGVLTLPPYASVVLE